jgi:hypothetical protein
MASERPMLTDFLNSLRVPHKDGAVDDLPPSMDDAQLRTAVDQLLAKYAPEKVTVYLQSFYRMNEAGWDNLKALLEGDPRLQLAA